MKESEPNHTDQESAEPSPKAEQNEAEKVQDVKEIVAETTGRIDEIAELLEQSRSLWQEVNNDTAKISEMSNEILLLTRSANAKAVNKDLRKTLNHMIHHRNWMVDSENWLLVSENLKKIRKTLGSFAGSDREAIAVILKNVPIIEQRYYDLQVKIKETRQKCGEALKIAEQKRVELMQDLSRYQDSTEVENLKKQYQEKTNRSFDYKLKYYDS
ncbi:MAG: hypothetical protein WDN47_00875 [Candidatus Doudnabacteria bacterium]